MVNIAERYAGGFLKPHDIEVDTDFTIASVDAQEDQFGRTVVRFTDGNIFSANSTQSRTIGRVLGDNETDHWSGRTITLYPSKYKREGQEGATIGVKASSKDDPKAAKEFQAAQPAKPVDADLDDEIPF